MPLTGLLRRRTKVKIRSWLEIGLGLALLVGYVYVRQVEKSRDTMLLKTIFLANHLDAQVTLTNGLLIELKRLKDGSVKSVTRFVPPEGRIDVRIPTDKSEKPSVVVTKSGLTFRPGVNFCYLGQSVIGADSKIFFFGRYGALIGGNKEGIFIGASRYLDDLVPYWHPRNIE